MAMCYVKDLTNQLSPSVELMLSVLHSLHAGTNNVWILAKLEILAHQISSVKCKTRYQPELWFAAVL